MCLLAAARRTFRPEVRAGHDAAVGSSHPVRPNAPDAAAEDGVGLLEQYQAARDDGKDAVNRQQEVIRFGLTGVAILVAFAETRGDPAAGAIVYLLVPFAALVTLAVWFGQLERMLHASRVIAAIASRSRLKVVDAGWTPQQEIRISGYWPIASALILATGVSIYLETNEALAASFFTLPFWSPLAIGGLVTSTMTIRTLRRYRRLRMSP